MRNLVVVFVLLGVTRVTSADPFGGSPASHDIGLLGGLGANISATGGPNVELGLHFRDVAAISGSATMMGEWYHAVIEIRWFPMQGEWRPYLMGGIGALNDEDLFEDFVEIGVGCEHRSSSGHWALFGEVALDHPYSYEREEMSIAPRSTPYLGLGLRFYY